MRTIDPKNIKSDFKGAIGDIGLAYNALSTLSLDDKSRNLITEYSFLSAAILLEGFISDIFVAYINKNSTAFSTSLTGSMSVTSENKVAKRAISTGAVNIKIKPHLTAGEIRSILDERDYNVTFSSTGDLKSKAGQWLEQPYKGYFVTLTQQQIAFLEAVKATRNFLAHRSEASRKNMQTALSNVDLHPELKRGTNNVRDVGAFLGSKPIGHSTTRLNSYLAHLESVANYLCP